MVNTWKTSYFQNDGIRVLFVLPQSWTDAFIPMSIVPKPKQVVRVMVGRLELLSTRARATGRGRGPRPGRPGRRPGGARRSGSSASRAVTSSRSSVASRRRLETTACGTPAAGCS